MDQRTVTNEEIYTHIQGLLCRLFELEEAAIHPQANLYEELDIDSIDAVDLVVELKKWSGKKINPDDFKSVETVQDVVDAVAAIFDH